MSDSSLTDQAAAAVDGATDSAAGAAERVTDDVAAVAETAKAGTAKAADTARTEATKAVGTARTEATKAADTATTEVTKAVGEAKAQTAAAADKVADKADDVAAKADGAAEKQPAPPRSMDEIEAELEATRQRLAGRIDDLTDYVKPANIVERQKNKLKSVFVDEYGGIKPDRVLMAAGIVVAVVGLGVLRRRRRRA